MKSKLFFAITLTFVSLIAYAQSKPDTLTNAKIIQLTKIGLQSSVIINKIQTSYTSFNVSTDALINLNSNGVSADVINEMMKTDTKVQMEVANQKDMNDPLTKRSAGIYYYDPKDANKPLKKVNPTVTSSNKSGGFGTALAQSMTSGLAKNKLTSSVAGAKSHLQTNTSTPVFYFYFENNANPNADSWFFATATSPNEFMCVELDERRDRREMVVGSANAYGRTSGISNRDKIPFEMEEVGEGIFKVTFKKPIDKGEYCFLYASEAPTRYSNNKVFDFGVSNEALKNEKLNVGDIVKWETDGSSGYSKGTITSLQNGYAKVSYKDEKGNEQTTQMRESKLTKAF